MLLENKNQKENVWKDGSQNLASIQTVRDCTLLHGPTNLMGPIKYVPFGIRRVTEPEDSHAFFHAALKAWKTSISSILIVDSNKLTMYIIYYAQPPIYFMKKVY